jgi:hypothetical protein
MDFCPGHVIRTHADAEPSAVAIALEESRTLRTSERTADRRGPPTIPEDYGHYTLAETNSN